MEGVFTKKGSKFERNQGKIEFGVERNENFAGIIGIGWEEKGIFGVASK